MQTDEPPAAAGRALTAGDDGRILLSTDADVSVLCADDDGDAAVFVADAIHVGAGEALVVQAPDGRRVKVLAGLLEVADGGRVVMEAHVELHAERAVFGRECPFCFVGADGRPGTPGRDGERGRTRLGQGASGRPGETGGAGVAGQPGPGGGVYLREVRGTLTVVAGGGSGGRGGAGGRGGDGEFSEGYILGDGGNGGSGGSGGHGGDGGTVLIVFGTLAAGATINPVTKPALGGDGGTGGGGGAPAGTASPGRNGEPGKRGDDGAVPVFLIRSDA